METYGAVLQLEGSCNFSNFPLWSLRSYQGSNGLLQAVGDLVTFVWNPLVTETEKSTLALSDFNPIIHITKTRFSKILWTFISVSHALVKTMQSVHWRT
jgi:hypothetical protein